MILLLLFLNIKNCERKNMFFGTTCSRLIYDFDSDPEFPGTVIILFSYAHYVVWLANNYVKIRTRIIIKNIATA